MSPIHSRVITLSSDGTAVDGSVAVPPCRYAGAYYRFDDNDGLQRDITIRNLGQVLLQKLDAAESDGIQDVAPDAMPVVSGNVVASVTRTAGGEVTVLQLFFDY